MVIEYKFLFDNGVCRPSIEFLLSELREKTGLRDIHMKNSGVYQRFFGEAYFGIIPYKDSSQIYLWTTYNLRWYLLEAMISVLKEMGAHCDIDLNPMAAKKWSEVKDTYKSHRIFDSDLPDEEIDYSKGKE